MEGIPQCGCYVSFRLRDTFILSTERQNTWPRNIYFCKWYDIKNVNTTSLSRQHNNVGCIQVTHMWVCMPTISVMVKEPILKLAQAKFLKVCGKMVNLRSEVAILYIYFCICIFLFEIGMSFCSSDWSMISILFNVLLML